MAKNGMLGLIGILVVLVIAFGLTGSGAWLGDSETSTDNTFVAGTLDLNLDGGNNNVVKFDVANFTPGDQQIGTWRLCNVGSVDGFLDLENIAVSHYENACLEPEIEAGDTSCGNPGPGKGNLQHLVGLDLFWDRVDCDGWFDTDDGMLYQSQDGPAGGIAANYEANEPLNAGSCVCITAQFKWWSNRYGNDNLAQSDSMTIDITFELGQTASQ